MKKISIVFVMLLSVCFLSRCKKDKSTTTFPNDPTADVYIAGNYTPAGKFESAACWLNGTFVPLEDGSVYISHAYSIIRYNGHTYVAGDYGNKPCVWEDGVRKMVDENYQGFIKGFALHNVNAETHLVIYGARGTAQNLTPHAFAMDWVTKTILYEINQNVSSAIYGFNSESGSILMSGLVGSQAALIKVGVGENQLGESSLVSAIRYRNSKYYFSSYLRVDPNTIQSGYFENSTFTPIGVSTKVTITDLDFDESGTMILVGSTSDTDLGSVATIWENNTPTLLSKTSSQAQALCVFNKFVYVVGKDNSTACYWVNKQEASLNIPNSRANAIYVCAKN